MFYKRSSVRNSNYSGQQIFSYTTTFIQWEDNSPNPENTKGGGYHCTIDFLFDRFGISCMTTDNCCFYLQNRLIQTSQTGGQWYIDTSPFSIPWQQQQQHLQQL